MGDLLAWDGERSKRRFNPFDVGAVQSSSLRFEVSSCTINERLSAISHLELAI